MAVIKQEIGHQICIVLRKETAGYLDWRPRGDSGDSTLQAGLWELRHVGARSHELMKSLRKGCTAREGLGRNPERALCPAYGEAGGRGGGRRNGQRGRRARQSLVVDV